MYSGSCEIVVLDRRFPLGLSILGQVIRMILVEIQHSYQIFPSDNPMHHFRHAPNALESTKVVSLIFAPDD